MRTRNDCNPRPPCAHLQVDDHEKRIREAEKAIKAHAQLLGTHGQILEEHGERLHTREEIADQHAVSILNLQVREWACARACACGHTLQDACTLRLSKSTTKKQAQTKRHEQNFADVQEQFEERQRTREALIGMPFSLSQPFILVESACSHMWIFTSFLPASLDNQFKEMTLRISQEELNLQNFKDSTSLKLAQERKQTLGDISALEKRVGSRVDSLRKEVHDNEASTVERLKTLETHVNTEVERVEKTFNEKWVKLGNDVERQTRLLKKSIEENLKSTQVALAGVADKAASNLQLAKLEIISGQETKLEKERGNANARSECARLKSLLLFDSHDR